MQVNVLWKLSSTMKNQTAKCVVNLSWMLKKIVVNGCSRKVFEAFSFVCYFWELPEIFLVWWKKNLNFLEIFSQDQKIWRVRETAFLSGFFLEIVENKPFFRLHIIVMRMIQLLRRMESNIHSLRENGTLYEFWNLANNFDKKN